MQTIFERKKKPVPRVCQRVGQRVSAIYAQILLFN